MKRKRYHSVGPMLADIQIHATTLRGGLVLTSVLLLAAALCLFLQDGVYALLKYVFLAVSLLSTVLSAACALVIEKRIRSVLGLYRREQSSFELIHK